MILLLIFLGLLFKRLNPKSLLSLCILLASCLELIFQRGFGASEKLLSQTEAYHLRGEVWQGNRIAQTSWYSGQAAMQMAGWIRGTDLGVVIGLWLMAWPSLAQDPYRVRGSIVDVDLPKVRVETRDDELLDLTLSESTHVFVATPAGQDDIRRGQFVGITSVAAQHDQRVALEVHIFAEDLRGLGEGHYPWNLVDEPNMMTNATIVEIEMITGLLRLTVTYADNWGEQQGNDRLQIDVPPAIPIVRLARGGPTVFASGKDVFLYLKDSEAGRIVPLAVIVGDGVRPPM